MNDTSGEGRSADRLRIPTSFDLFKPFPLHVLPDNLRRYVQAQSEALCCDPAYVVLPVLSMLGAVIGNSRRIELKSDWCEPPVIWTAIVGESGSMKSPAFRASLEVIRQKQRGANHRFNLELAEYKRDLQRYKTDAKRRGRQASDAVEAEFPEPEPSEPTRPTLDRYIVNNTTLEALMPILDENPRGVLINWDELSGWFGSFDRYAKSGTGGGDLAAWLSMHDADMLSVDRKTGLTPRIMVPSALVCICGGIQPGVLRRVLGERARQSGLAPRLLFAMPPRRKKVWSDREVGPELKHELDVLVDSLLSLKPERSAGNEWVPRRVPLGEEARLAWLEEYARHNEQQVQLDGDEASGWSKLEATIARVALIDHEVRVASRDPAAGDPYAVSRASIDCGAAVAQWFGAEMLRIYAMLDEPDHEQDARRLTDWMRRQGGRASLNEVCHGIRRFRGNAEGALRALEALVETGVCRQVHRSPGAKGGKPTTDWVLTEVGGAETGSSETPAGIGSSDEPGHQGVANPSDDSCQMAMHSLRSGDVADTGNPPPGGAEQREVEVSNRDRVAGLGGSTVEARQQQEGTERRVRREAGDGAGDGDQGGGASEEGEGEVAHGT
jgi:hypothetical protein